MHDLASLIDHTLLRADAVAAEFSRLCDEARTHGFATVCVPSAWVRFCAERVAESSAGVTTVIGFPLGCVSTAAKVAEAQQAVRDGATELDVVVHLGALRDRHYRTVAQDLGAVVQAADGRVVKVILETGALTPELIRVGAALAQSAGAQFVKTSTGFGPGGATIEAVALLRETVCSQIGVKASGGIRDEAAARAMVAAGATRLGTSAGVSIVQGTASTSSY
ncbi:MAG: deoxyribose-phosphate aldolase [Myxococcales bacterium]|nr:deoxyribose-phosphate aldolase [Myxococcales bacterium]MCB9627645.1 deoxyribose-phosphate aldolase [Sandaracinaceae bacterium]